MCERSVASEYIVDCSALVDALIGDDVAADNVRQRVSGARLHAPHLIDAEVGQVLRRKVRQGHIVSSVVPGRLRAARIAVQERYPHHPFSAAAWELHDNVGFYDALYVALAARLRLPLLTTDRKLADTPTGLPCEIECPV